MAPIFPNNNAQNISDFKEYIKRIKENAKYNVGAIINNTANGQQQAGKLENYLLSPSLYLSEEEIKEILKLYKKL